MTTDATPCAGIPNRFRQDLLARRRLIACWCSLANPVTTEVLGLAGFDWLLLDAGFYNFLIPFVESADEARRAVAATRYQPAGVRGVSVSQRHNRYGTVPDYPSRVNESVAVMVQIESRPGLDAVDSIAAVDGVEGVFVGPSGLAAAPGHLGNAGNSEVQQAIRRLFDRAAAQGNVCGMLAPVEADARRYLDWGASSLRSAATSGSSAARRRRCPTGSGRRTDRTLRRQAGLREGCTARGVSSPKDRRRRLAVSRHAGTPRVVRSVPARNGHH